MAKGTKEIRECKDSIRKELIRRLKDQDPSLREERSRAIQEKLLSSEEYRAAETVMTYVSLPTEVSTDYFNDEAVRQGKRVLVPYMEPGDPTIKISEFTSSELLEEGPFGIRQVKRASLKEATFKEIDLVVVPAIAYDKDNMRLGRGKGCYDNFLSNEDLSCVKTIGLAFSFQIVDSVPSLSHDRPVHRVITD